MAKVMRIAEDAETEALLHGDTVSKGIIEMGMKLKKAEATIDLMKVRAKIDEESVVHPPTSFHVPELIDGMPKEYWKRMKKELESFVELAKREY